MGLLIMVVLAHGQQLAPTITVQPVSIEKPLGNAASFNVTATGTAPLSYQWLKDGVAIAGANSATYTISSVQLSDAGVYSVVVSNVSGKVESATTSLIVWRYDLFGEGTVEITAVSYPTNGIAIQIPALLDGLLVVSIGNYAFAGGFSLSDVSIPDSVKYIGDDAFYGCTGLKGMTIPSSVSFIGDDAFLDCTSLTDITIPDSVTHLGYGAFYACTSLTNITIPSSLKIIGDDAFYRCTSLTGVHFLGDAPIVNANVFFQTQATVYYEPGTSGWTDTLGGRPTKLALPALGVTLSLSPTAKISVAGAVGSSVRVESAANPTGPWTTLTNVTLSAGGLVLPDSSPISTAKFYRATATP
jgi:BspA type Leucine rich repeat region (6 copies)/Immunoglobulin domain